MKNCMVTLINKLYMNKLMSHLFHTSIFCLQRELKDCQSVLDLGCGPGSPLQYCKNIKYSVGVEAFESYLEESKKKKIHVRYLDKRIEELDFSENSFDAVIMIEVLEHLPQKVGLEILRNVEKWAKKKVVVSSPNGFISQKELDNNPYQRHLSGWDHKKMKKMEFRIKGLAGLKFLRQEVQNDAMKDDLMTSIKYRPKIFWFAIASLTQIVTYYIPQLAFELFSVKKVSK